MRVVQSVVRLVCRSVSAPNLKRRTVEELGPFSRSSLGWVGLTSPIQFRHSEERGARLRCSCGQYPRLRQGRVAAQHGEWAIGDGSGTGTDSIRPWFVRFALLERHV